MAVSLNIFEQLTISIDAANKEAKNLHETFKIAFGKAYPKRYKKAVAFKREIEFLKAQLCEYNFDNGNICKGCRLEGTFCEGRFCETQMDLFYYSLDRNELIKKLYSCLGDRFYSLSRRMKNELLKPE